jgi:hypothetical protein
MAKYTERKYTGPVSIDLNLAGKDACDFGMLDTMVCNGMPAGTEANVMCGSKVGKEDGDNFELPPSSSRTAMIVLSFSASFSKGTSHSEMPWA